MTASLWLRDIGSYALQVAVIVAAGAALWQALRVRHAALTYGYWRALLLACLLLPLLQPWHASPSPVSPTITLARADNAGAAVAGDGRGSAGPRSWPVPPRRLLLTALAAGAAGRALWLVIGAFGLRRLRRASRPIEPLPPGIRAAQARLAINDEACTFLTGDRITSPITFGFRRPVVIVPSRVLSMEPDLQEAIACHELMHVARRDWLKVLAEEAIRTVLWFHPAIWWLVGRIQLCREHVVDEAVIRLTRSRDRYVDAMLAVALTRSSIVPTPASLFLRRRFLKRRVAHILQEVTMTTRRLIASVTFSAAALSVVAILATRAFPLEAQAPKASPDGLQGGPVEIARGGEHLLHGSLPSYPRRAIEQRVEGEVVLDVSIDERGEVTDARVTSGPEELRRAALEAVLQWHYASDKVRSTSSQVALRFRVPAKSEPQKFEAVVKQEGESKRYTLTVRPHLTKERIAASLGMELQLATLAKALDDPALDQDRRAELEQKRETMRRKLEESRRLEETRDLAVDIHEAVPVLTRIKADGLPASFVRQIETAAGIKVGEPLTKEVMERVAEVVRSLDEHLLVRVQPVPGGGVMLVLIAP